MCLINRQNKFILGVMVMIKNDSKQINTLNYENILSLIPNPVLLIDNLDKIIFVNFAAELIFGESAKLLKKKSLQELLSPDSQLFSLVNQVKNQGFCNVLQKSQFSEHVSTWRCLLFNSNFFWV